MHLQQIHQHLIQHKQTLAVAESCTGGAVASQFVAIPDCSLYFMGGVIAYTNRAKEKILGVKGETLKEFGAVSESVAQEMAEGALEQFESHYALATTGIAGPSGGTANKPVGMVCFALVSRIRPVVAWTSYFSGERREIISQATADALDRLGHYIV